jgi:NAD-dependent deacetylase
MSWDGNSLETSHAAQTAAKLLRSAQHAVVFTGAGISTPSGIPDFRSRGGGLWERYNPMEVASISTFQSHPELFYGWLGPLLAKIWAAQPNAAHTALAQLEAAGRIKAVITQNIDDLHQRAGSQNIYEVHGSLRTVTCPRCQDTYPSEQFRDQVDNAIKKALETNNGIFLKADLPHCPKCRRVLKPDITLFGEMLPSTTWMEAEAHCQKADLILVAGSSLEVWPAASLPELAVQQGAHLIINNLNPTHLDGIADVLLAEDVASIIPQIARLVL